MEAVTVNTADEKRQTVSRWLQYGCLLVLACMEVLYFLLEYRANGIAYTYIESYAIMFAMIFVGVTLTMPLSRQTKRLFIVSLGMILWLWVSRTAHRIHGVGSQEIGSYVCAYALFLPFASAAQDGTRQWGLKLYAWVFAAMGVLLISYCLMLSGNMLPEYLQEGVRWNGFRFNAMGHPNACAGLLILAMGATLYLLATLRKLWLRILLALLAIGEFLVLVLTNSRTTIAFACVLIGGSIFCALRKTGWKRLIAVGLAALLVVGGLFVGSQKLTEKRSAEVAATRGVEALKEAGQGSLKTNMKTLNGRIGIWSAAIAGLEDNPGIKYVGADYPWLILSQHGTTAYNTHNSWLETLYEWGAPALLGALILTVLAVYDSLVILWYNRNLNRSIIALLVLCFLGCAMLETYLFHGGVFYHPYNFLFMLCLGYLDCWRAELRKSE